jgi:hypothetical protein
MGEGATGGKEGLGGRRENYGTKNLMGKEGSMGRPIWRD